MPEPSSERSEVRSPRRTCVRSPAATLSTSPPSIVPIRFLASEQSASKPMPPTGMMSPPPPCRNSASPPMPRSTAARLAPGKSGDATFEFGPMTTVWQP